MKMIETKMIETTNVTQQVQTLNSKLEMLDALSEVLLLPEKFARVDYNVSDKTLTSYVGKEPLKSSRKFSYRDEAGVTEYVNDSGVVLNLFLHEEVYLYGKASKRFGINLRHGSLRETLAAAWLREAEDFKRNVITRYWVKNNEFIRRLGTKYEVSRVVGGGFTKVKVKAQPQDLFVKRKGKLLCPEWIEGKVTLKPTIDLGPPLQTGIPTRSGYYSNFAGAIPITRELGERNAESRGFFDVINYDRQGLASVGSRWDPVDGVLYADAGRPLVRGLGSALGVWSDENPKK